MLVDTHSHLNFKAYDSDRDEVIKRTFEQGVVCIDVGTKYETSKMAIELAEENKEIFASVGMHPIHIKTDLMKIKMDEEEGAFEPLGEEFDKEKYKELTKSKRVVAIGEIGLDYYYKPKTKTRLEQFKDLQKNVFVQQLELAQELNLPVIIHCRMAHDNLIEILKNYKLSGVIHCFTGSVKEMEQYLALGFYIGFNGIIYKLDMAEAIKKCPLERVLLETDCPYLTPPLAHQSPEDKGGRNEPVFVKYIAQTIAEAKGVNFEETTYQTTKNAKNLFKI